MLKILLFVILFFTIQCAQTKKIDPITSEVPSVLQGLTTDKKTQISVLRHQSQVFEYELSLNAQVKVETKSSKGSYWRVDHLYVTNIRPNTQYKLDIKNINNIIISTRYFKAYDIKKTNQKIAIASCMDDRLKDAQKNMWPHFISKKADLHFFIGDNVYADVGAIKKGVAKPSELWKRYVSTRRLLEIYKTPHLTPTLATWDDHDYGNNGGGINYPYKEESKNIFYSFFAQDPIKSQSYQSGPGISFYFKSGGQNFYFMDNRSFRTNKKEKNDSHWGSDQQNWLVNNLSDDQRFSWLINGNQFFGAYHRFESFEKNHPKSFNLFKTQLNNLTTKVAFISGDRHLFEVMEIKPPDLNYSTIELTTSAIHAKVYPSSWDKEPNPRQLYGAAQKYNFAVLNINTIPGGASFTLNGYGPANELLYTLDKKIK